MKSTFLKITLMAFITIGAFSCKNNEKEAETLVEEASEASEMATEYTVDTAASTIMWEGAKPTGKHHGTIKLSSGTVHLNNGNIEAGEFVIDMNSITDEDLEGDDKANLEAHLKGTVEGKEGECLIIGLSHAQYDGSSLPMVLRDLEALYSGSKVVYS